MKRFFNCQLQRDKSKNGAHSWVQRPRSSWNSAIQEAEYLIYSIFFQAVFSRLGNVACLARPVIYVERLGSLLRIWDRYIEDGAGKTLDAVRALAP